MKTHVIFGAAALALISTPALSQVVQEQTTVVKEKPSGAAAGAVTGAATGAAVGGPVGAAVGAVTGAVVGAVAVPPAEVRTYVTTHDVPAVTYGQPIVVGRPIPGEVSWLDVPNYPKYRWAYLDGRRVVVDANTHAVVAVYAPDPPAGVRSFVTTQSVPVVKYGHEIVVGEPLTGEIAWLDVPNYPKFRWAYVDGRRVVIDRDTNTVVATY